MPTTEGTFGGTEVHVLLKEIQVQKSETGTVLQETYCADDINKSTSESVTEVQVFYMHISKETGKNKDRLITRINNDLLGFCHYPGKNAPLRGSRLW